MYGYQYGGVGAYLTVLGAQNKDSLRETITVALRFTVVLALVFTAVNICVPRQIMELYTNESPVIEGEPSICSGPLLHIF